MGREPLDESIESSIGKIVVVLPGIDYSRPPHTIRRIVFQNKNSSPRSALIHALPRTIPYRAPTRTCEPKDLVEMVGPPKRSQLSFSQPAATRQMIAAAGSASAQNRLTLMTEIVSVRMFFIFVI